MAGSELKALVDKRYGTPHITATKVRVRLRYPLTTALTGQVFGPWRYMPGYLDGLGMHNNIPLPVEMLWMEAACVSGTPTIAWATATEHNSSHFIIERSIDAETWESISRVTSAGNSQQVIEYAWRDEAPLRYSTAYYRLRQEDLDGREEVLAVLPLEACVEASTELMAMPNPTDGSVDVRWHNLPGLHSLIVMDMHGRELLRVLTGTDAIHRTLDLSGLSAGTYAVVAVDSCGARVGSARVVRQ